MFKRWRVTGGVAQGLVRALGPVVGLLVATTAGGQSLPDDWLVSPAEVARYQGTESQGLTPPVLTKAFTPGPVIEVLKPQLSADQKVVAPFAITVQFKPLPDAEIVPGSFRVLYGFMKLDITSRITQYVTVTPTGFALDNAKIPAGKHNLLLQVQDSRQRTAERELRLEVQ